VTFDHRLPLLLMLLLTTLSACGPSGSGDASTTGHAVRVTYEGKPIGSVVVRLYADMTPNASTPSYLGFSNNQGMAYLNPADGDSVPFAGTQWSVALLSDGDGGWMLDPKLGDPTGANIQFYVDDITTRSEQVPTIEVPRGAVRSLGR
jgi:hypothetical protein